MDVTVIFEILRAIVMAAAVANAPAAEPVDPTPSAPAEVIVTADPIVPAPTDDEIQGPMEPLCETIPNGIGGVACNRFEIPDHLSDARRTESEDGTVILWGDHGYPVGAIGTGDPRNPNYVAPEPEAEPAGDIVMNDVILVNDEVEGIIAIPAEPEFEPLPEMPEQSAVGGAEEAYFPPLED